MLLDIKAFRVALPADPRPGEVTFDIARPAPPVDLRRVLDDPAWARARIEAEHSVWLFFKNAHNVPGRFLGRFDRHTVPHTTTFRIGFYPDRSITACGGPPTPWEYYRRMCERFERLARNPPALDGHGFVVDRPDFLRGANNTFYIFPSEERLSATGEPVFFACHNTLGYCRNSFQHLWDGYFVKPGVRLLYEFTASRHPERTWRDVDARFRAVVDNLITDAPRTHP